MKYTDMIWVWMLLGCLHQIQAQNFDLGDIQTTVTPTQFHETFTFEEVDDLMFLRVRLNQSSREFRFLVDTGAPTGISPEVAKIIRPKLGRKVLVQSSGAKNDSLGLVLLDAVKIGNLTFSQVVAFVAQFNQGEIMKCYEIDGIIGGNLMAAAIWQFNKLTKKIHITDDLSNLSYTRKSKRLNFDLYGWQKSPLLDVTINKKRIREKILLDTGYGGFFSWSRNTFSEALRRKFIDTTQILRGSGTAVETIFGKDADSVVYTVQLENIVLGKIKFNAPVVDVDLDRGSKLGVKLINNYILTLDFPNQHAYTHEIKSDFALQELKSFGFSAYIRGNDIYVTLLWENSPAMSAGMQLYDRIVEVDGISFRQIDAFNKCLLFLKLRNLLYNQDEIEISFASEGNTTTTRLRKEILLGN